MKKFAILFVAALAFGFASCGTGKAVVDNGTKKTQTASFSGDMSVNTDESKVEWIGKKSSGQHTGTLNVKEGNLKIEKGQIKGGKFVIDMNSITSTDLEGGSKNSMEGHLKNADFFDVSNFPEATFEITDVGNTANTKAPFLVAGKLKILKIEKDISFNANINITDDKLSATTPEFSLDRTLWGINYKSSKSDTPGIDDNIYLKITLVANP